MKFQEGDVVLISGPYHPQEADWSIRQFDGHLGIVTGGEEDLCGYVRVFCPTHPQHQKDADRGDTTLGTSFLPTEVTRMVVGSR